MGNSSEVAVVEKGIQINPEALLAKGIEHNLSIEGMQKLLDMRAQLKAENAKEEFFKALSKFQKECPVIEKRKVVRGRNGEELYRYAPIEDIISQVSDKLEANGFSFTFKTAQAQGTLSVKCEAHHVAGHTEVTEITVPIGSGGIISGVQQIGSATTYAKRYSFCNQFGILTGDEDDDGSTDTRGPEKQNPPSQTSGAVKAQPPSQGKSAAPEQEGNFPYMLKDGETIPEWFKKMPAKERVQYLPKGAVITNNVLHIKSKSA